MKKSKLAFLAGVWVASALFLASCGSSSKSSQTNTYIYVFSTDPDSLDTPFQTVLQVTLPTWLMDCLYYLIISSLYQQKVVCFQDGLELIPAIKRCKWYDKRNEYADVTAQDFVTSLKYVADNKSDAPLWFKTQQPAWMTMSLVKATDFSKGWGQSRY